MSTLLQECIHLQGSMPYPALGHGLCEKLQFPCMHHPGWMMHDLTPTCSTSLCLCPHFSSATYARLQGMTSPVCRVSAWESPSMFMPPPSQVTQWPHVYWHSTRAPAPLLWTFEHGTGHLSVLEWLCLLSQQNHYHHAVHPGAFMPASSYHRTKGLSQPCLLQNVCPHTLHSGTLSACI